MVRKTRISNSALTEYCNVRKSELNRQWNNFRANKDRKFENMKGDGNRDVPDKFRGILVSDDLLKANFQPTPVDVAVYGDIVVTEPMREFLKLPSNFQTYSDMKMINDEV